MLALTAPLSCRQAAYTSGRREKPFVKLGTWPNNSRSVSYIAAASPVARSSGTASMKLMPASFPSAAVASSLREAAPARIRRTATAQCLGRPFGLIVRVTFSVCPLSLRFQDVTSDGLPLGLSRRTVQFFLLSLIVTVALFA